MITILVDGRLGNQLFQYVVCRTLSKIKGYDFIFPTNYKELIQNNFETNLSDFFEIEIGVDNLFFNKVYKENSNTLEYDSKIFEISDFTLLVGFFQSDLYFKQYESQIKSWIKIKNPTHAHKILQKYDKENHCFIHVRGGDYKQLNWILPKKYYDDAISKMLSIKNNLKFVVITDDLQKAIEYFPEYLCLTNDMMTDFEILKLAKYSIIANSSFSWWAAWLSENQTTIAPEYWINYNTRGKGWFPMNIKTDKFIWV